MTDDELKAIEARANAATGSMFDRESALQSLIQVGLSQQDVPALVAEVRRLRRFLKGALIALPSLVGKALLDDCGINYAENTTAPASLAETTLAQFAEWDDTMK